MGGKQHGYSDYELTATKKETKWEKLLSEIEVVLPWKALIDLIERCYLKASEKGGRPSWPLSAMLRIHLLQHGYSFSDPARGEALIEAANMCHIASIDLISQRIYRMKPRS
jgi:IS5 family transposase